MFSSGNILYFTPFHFPNGNQSKNKYFIVLANDDDSLIIASLPTSHDHIPVIIEKRHGCINNDEMRVNCYFFESKRIISDCGTFGFPIDTYVYGEQVQMLSLKKLNEAYPQEGKDYLKLASLSKDEFKALRQCLYSSGSTKNKIKRYLK